MRGRDFTQNNHLTSVQVLHFYDFLEVRSVGYLTITETTDLEFLYQNIRNKFDEKYILERFTNIVSKYIDESCYRVRLIMENNRCPHSFLDIWITDDKKRALAYEEKKRKYKEHEIFLKELHS